MSLTSTIKYQAISFQPVKLEDAEDLVTLRIEAMRESLDRIGRFDPLRARERFLSGFSQEHTRHIIVELQRVGFVVVRPTVELIHLDHLYVHPAHQNQKIGSMVLSLIIEEANALQLPVRVGALRDSDSNRFYIRHGFELVEQSEYDNYYIRRV